MITFIISNIISFANTFLRAAIIQYIWTVFIVPVIGFAALPYAFFLGGVFIFQIAKLEIPFSIIIGINENTLNEKDGLVAGLSNTIMLLFSFAVIAIIQAFMF
jgi:hypothetical protein